MNPLAMTAAKEPRSSRSARKVSFLSVFYRPRGREAYHCLLNQV